MMRDHLVIDELLAVRALGGLDGDDAAILERELAAHGDCDECRRLEAGHAEVAGMLPFALDPRPLDDTMVDRIVREPQRPTATAVPPPDELSARRDARLGRWQAAFGVAAAVALILVVVLAVRPGSGPTVLPDTIVPFEGPTGELALAYTPGQRGVLVWGTGLPDLEAGEVYELWMIEDGTPVRGACFPPEQGTIAAFLDADVGTTEVMAVTVERRTCPESPTTDPLYTAELA